VIVDVRRSLGPLSGFRDERLPEFDTGADEPRGIALLLLEPTKLFRAFPPVFLLSQEGLDELPRFLSNSTHSLGFSHSKS
jgi:hypothetical protein